jgi:hypothetical protein
MRKRKKQNSRAFLDGFATVRSVIELDELSLTEVLESIHPESDLDLFLTPWKRGFQAGIRTAFGL